MHIYPRAEHWTAIIPLFVREKKKTIVVCLLDCVTDQCDPPAKCLVKIFEVNWVLIYLYLLSFISIFFIFTFTKETNQALILYLTETNW